MKSVEILRGEDFKSLLFSLKLECGPIYEDLSETGVVLWNNDHLSLKIVSEYGRNPSLQIVAAHGPDYFVCFNCDISKFDASDVELFTQYIINNYIEIANAAIVAANNQDELPISIAWKNLPWIFQE